MMRYIYTLLLAIILASCATSRPITTETHTTDTHYIERLDSVFLSTFLRDSIYIRDSIFVRDRGDTVMIFAEKIRYKYQLRTDTIFKEVSVRDTLEHTDSIMVERPVYIEREVPWHNQLFMALGKLCTIACGMWLLMLWARRK